MAVIIKLEDGRALRGSTMGIGGMLLLIADEVSDEFAELRRWLRDLWERTAPFLDFDVRGLLPAHRGEFWCAAEQAHAKLIERYGPRVFEEKNAFSAGSLDRALRMHRSIEAGETPEEIFPFNGKMIDLGELWGA